ncbi:MAG TPA: hypothetical protein VGF60_18805 [Xanthobacteraceae bacterium]
MIAEGQVFRDKRIYLDGSSFYQCTFERCTVVYSGTLGFVLESPQFIDCRWEVQGAARETLGFLRALYAGGARDLVEQTFQSIRSGTGTTPLT